MLVDCVFYENGGGRGREVSFEDACSGEHEGRGFAWLRLHEPSEDELDSVKREFDLPELAVEDALKARQRPKLERYGRTLFLVLKPVRYLDEQEDVEVHELGVFIGPGYVISVSHGHTGALDAARERLDESPQTLADGPAAVLHTILDVVVDDYLPVAAGIEQDLEEIEREVFSVDRVNPASRIYRLEQEVLDFHRAVAPLVPALEDLESQGHELIGDSLRPAYRDVYDHALRMRSQIEVFRSLLTDALQANLTQVSVRQNEDMRKISAWVGIFVVPTLIAAIYGMNFEHMPELSSPYGYPAALAAMALIAVLLYWRFKRAGWL